MDTKMDSISVIRPSRRTGFFLAAACLFAASAFAIAEEVTTQLTSQQTRVGQPVQMMVTVTGGRAELPQTLSVNGLQISLAGQRSSSSAQFGSGGFQATTSTTYIYLVVPQFEGEFMIPAFDVTVGGRAFQTKPMRLSVGTGSAGGQAPPPQSAPGQPQQPRSSSSSSSNARPYFAELILTKKKAYVGEVVPAELRFYFSSRMSGQLGDRPNFGGEGFTVQKFSNAARREQVIDGETFQVFSFQTSITPVKIGTLAIPVAKLDARLQVPGSAPQGIPDIFGNLGGMFSQSQDVAIESKPSSIEVLPLPKEGRPDDFSGAIGQFTMDVTASPKKTEPGEPVTLTANIAGKGNFESMAAPTLTADEDWRSYPPAEKISTADSIGFTGEKKFDFTLVARKDQTLTPGLTFSYFDPDASKFETIVQPPLPVDARAATASTAPSPVPSTPTTTDTPATPPPAPTGTPDIAAMASGASSWLSILQRRDFWLANAVLAIAWLAVAAVLNVRRFAASSAGARAARRRKAQQLLAELRATDPKLFDEKAVQYLCIRLETDPLSISPRLDALTLPEDVRGAIEKILHREAESKYATGTSTPPSSEIRAEALAALAKLEACREK